MSGGPAERPYPSHQRPDAKSRPSSQGLCADTDVWGVFRGAGKSGYAVLHMENGDLVGRETELLTAPMEESAAELLAAVTAQYYLPRAILPHEILLCVDTGDCEELSEALTQRAGHKVWVHVPQRGEKSTLADMAVRNAQEEVRRATTGRGKNSVYAGSPAKNAEPAPAAQTDGVFRYFQHRRQRHCGVHGGLSGGEAFEIRLSPVSDQGADWWPSR